VAVAEGREASLAAAIPFAELTSVVEARKGTTCFEEGGMEKIYCHSDGRRQVM
jgi:hypothetical protein